MVALASLRLEGRLVSKHIVVGAAVAGTSMAHSEHPFTGTDRGGVSGPVTVVSGNLDGGSPDFASILLNTRGVDASDFLFSARHRHKAPKRQERRSTSPTTTLRN